MVIFNSYVKLPEGNHHKEIKKNIKIPSSTTKSPFSHGPIGPRWPKARAVARHGHSRAAAHGAQHLGRGHCDDDLVLARTSNGQII